MILDYKNVLKKITPLLAGAATLVLLTVFCLMTAKIKTGQFIHREHLIFLAFSLAFVAALFFISKRIKLETLAVFVIVFFGVACMFIFPPHTVPDEPLHYRSAYHISNIMMFDFKDEPNGMYMRAEDYEFNSKASTSLSRKAYRFVSKNNYLFCKERETVRTHFDYMEGKGVVYFLPAIGISLARILGLSAYFTFQIGRLFNFAFFVAAVYISMRLMPFGKQMLAVVSAIPLNLHITASNSYDVFTIGGTFLIFAYILHIMYDDKKITWKQLLIFAVMVALVVPQKIVYIGVAALILIIPKERFLHPKWHFLFKCILGLLAVVSIFAFQLGNASKVTSNTVTNSEVAGYSLNYVIHNRFEMFKLFFNTFYTVSDFYTKTLVSFFGWFEVESPWFLTICVLGIVLISFMRQEDEPKSLKYTGKIYVFILLAMIWCLIELLLLLDWTPFGSATVEGVQGRYFIPALPLLFLLIRNDGITVKKSVNRQLMIAVGIMNVIILSDVICAILVR